MPNQGSYFSCSISSYLYLFLYCLGFQLRLERWYVMLAIRPFSRRAWKWKPGVMLCVGGDKCDPPTLLPKITKREEGTVYSFLIFHLGVEYPEKT